MKVACLYKEFGIYGEMRIAKLECGHLAGRVFPDRETKKYPTDRVCFKCGDGVYPDDYGDIDPRIVGIVSQLDKRKRLYGIDSRAMVVDYPQKRKQYEPIREMAFATTHSSR